MADWLEDLKARWEYHPTFKRNVVIGAVLVYCAVMLGAYLSMTPECRRDMAVADWQAPPERQQESIEACRSSED